VKSTRTNPNTTKIYHTVQISQKHIIVVTIANLPVVLQNHMKIALNDRINQIHGAHHHVQIRNLVLSHAHAHQSAVIVVVIQNGTNMDQNIINVIQNRQNHALARLHDVHHLVQVARVVHHLQVHHGVQVQVVRVVHHLQVHHGAQVQVVRVVHHLQAHHGVQVQVVRVVHHLQAHHGAQVQVVRVVHHLLVQVVHRAHHLIVQALVVHHAEVVKIVVVGVNVLVN
jgi:hypothetical protein